MPPEDVASDLDFRWQAWFQRSDEAVFLLSARRRLVFVNRAWEKATGLLLKEVRGMSCRRRPRRVLAEKTELILGALAPPPEVWKGRSCESRRLLPAIGREASAVIVVYLPLGGRVACLIGGAMGAMLSRTARGVGILSVTPRKHVKRQQRGSFSVPQAE